VPSNSEKGASGGEGCGVDVEGGGMVSWGEGRGVEGGVLVRWGRAVVAEEVMLRMERWCGGKKRKGMWWRKG
jgi:hypothetical protein